VSHSEPPMNEFTPPNAESGPPHDAQLHNSRGEYYLNDVGDLEQVALAYAQATQLAPEWSIPWYNLGLVRKYQGRWGDSLRCNLRAAELDPEDDAAWWNAGIAATALGDWKAARRAWEAVGIALPPGEGELQMSLGLTPVRLNPDGQGEVVWCDRIDPARAIVRNVPLPESGHRYGDLLLHDSAPNGTRVYQGQEVPVFDALQLLQASHYTTYQVRARVGGEEDVLALVELAEERGCGIEDWETIRRICAACSRGNPGPHEGMATASRDSVAILAIAARDDGELRELLDAWTADHPSRVALDLTVLVPSASQPLS
jgi:tetratricopeptide (TPR) repeat protein